MAKDDIKNEEKTEKKGSGLFVAFGKGHLHVRLDGHLDTTLFPGEEIPAGYPPKIIADWARRKLLITSEELAKIRKAETDAEEAKKKALVR